MPTYRDDALVLREHKLGEADRILTLLTRRNGKVRAVAKGVRKTSSKFGARLEPFGHVDLQLHVGRNLDIVTQAEGMAAYGPVIAADYHRYTVACAITEAADRLVAEEKEPAIRLFLLTLGALRTLAEDTRPAPLVLDAYLLRSMSWAGWSPALDSCAKCGTPGEHAGFNVAAGGLVCSTCRPPGSANPDPETVALLRQLLSGDWDAAVQSAPARRREASGLVTAYLQWHLERGLRSLALVDRS